MRPKSEPKQVERIPPGKQTLRDWQLMGIHITQVTPMGCGSLRQGSSRTPR